MIVKSITIHLLNRLRGAFVEYLAPFDQQGIVRYFLGESVLEDVLDFRKRGLLVDEFPGL